MPSQQSSLLFQVATPGVSRRDLRAFLKRLEAEVAEGRVFCCLITGDAELRRLNREFRGKDYPTDVLSFPLQKHPLPYGRGSVASASFRTASVSDRCMASLQKHPLPYGRGSVGEIAISYDAARRQSIEFGHDVNQEIQILMLHGLLHLLGMDHETDGGRMLSAERKWRIRLGLPAGLIERVSA
jgi:probable rRNA maturation factor